ncbi:plexin-C1-like isoform X1 [Thunnus thynnus]|uniref:plexin-C1-like isoform X1 n=1 Tax=Thunnus thynnus TaxID=8237 RepID=UPI003528A2C5
MILLSGLIFILLGKPGRCLEEDRDFIFDGDVRHFAVSTNTVYVATDEKLYQLNHDLTLVQSLTQRGILKGDKGADDQHFYRVSERDEWNATFSVNVLLPFDNNGTLITCGVTDNGCGYCELLDLSDISKVLYSEYVLVGSVKRSSASVTFLVDVKRSSPETYILSALQQDKSTTTGCSLRSEAVYLYNTNNKQTGGIFSFIADSFTPLFRTKSFTEFVDGFQISSIIYLFSNVPQDAGGSKVRLIWFEVKTNKVETVKSLRGASLHISDSGDKDSRLLASSVVPGGLPVLWSGVFSVDGGQTNTELVMFDISPDLTLKTDQDPDFCNAVNCDNRNVKPKTLKPKKVLLRQNYMTSVLAVRHKSWMVFFVGTGDGQVIKLAVDNNYHTTCPRVLYRSNDDRKVFPKIHLDKVDHKHVYMAFQNQMKRVPVSKCNTYKTLQECWSAQDPHCVWCGSNSCTFEDECPDSDWLSIPDDYQQRMVSYNVVKDGTEQITLNIQTHVTVGQKATSNFACQISASSNEFCSRGGPPPQFPQCTCILSNSVLPAEGLAVTVTIRLGTNQWSEQLKLMKCSDIRGPPTSVLCQQCIDVGCVWSQNGCSWATAGVKNYSVCQMVESGMNFSKPEISSITPSVVSFYGRNRAVLSGHNLRDVTRVRIQADMDCTPRESPVWNNTGVSLTFHIPSTDSKGMVKVCVLLPDGSCHGNSKITYRSLPACTAITPNSSWISGHRKIQVTGSLLEFVEGVIHSHAPQEVRLPQNRNSQVDPQACTILTYDTPAAENTQGISTSTVSLKVANATVDCPTSITYYPDPEFTSFTSTRTGNNEHMINIEKTADKLKMTTAELSVWGVQEGKPYFCNMKTKENYNEIDVFICEIQSTSNTEFQHLLIKYGDKTVRLGPPSSSHQVLLTLCLLLIPCIIVVLVIICWWKKKRSAR